MTDDQQTHCGIRIEGAAKVWQEGCTQAATSPEWCYCHCALCDRTSVRSGIRAPSPGREYGTTDEGKLWGWSDLAQEHEANRGKGDEGSGSPKSTEAAAAAAPVAGLASPDARQLSFPW